MWQNVNCCNITSGESVGIHCTLKSSSLQMWAILKSWSWEGKLADRCFASSQHKLNLRASLQRCTGGGPGALTVHIPGSTGQADSGVGESLGSPQTRGCFLPFFWLCWVSAAVYVFSTCRERELLSCCRAQALDAQASVVVGCGLSSCNSKVQ